MLPINLCHLLILTAYAEAVAAAIFDENPIVTAQGAIPAQEPFDLGSELQKRADVGCYFGNTNGSYCEASEICCWNFGLGTAYGGFCCSNQGRCCGNGCCVSGYNCAYADQTTFQCCSGTVDCSGGVTVTTKQTQISTQLSFITNTATITAAPIPASTGALLPTGTATTTACDSEKHSDVGPIIGGAVGGVAFVALLCAFLFIGARKGWFDKKQPTAIHGGAMGAGEQKHYYQGVQALPSHSPPIEMGVPTFQPGRPVDDQQYH